jgi:hypothetical protein
MLRPLFIQTTENLFSSGGDNAQNYGQQMAHLLEH